MVKRLVAYAIVLLWVFIPALLCILVVGRIPNLERQVRNDLATNGVTTTATIIERRDHIRDWAVKYRFEIENSTGQSETIESWESLDILSFYQLEATNVVEIQYDPQDPSVSRIVGTSRSIVDAIFLTLIVGGLIVVLIRAVRLLPSLHRE